MIVFIVMHAADDDEILKNVCEYSAMKFVCMENLHENYVKNYFNEMFECSVQHKNVICLSCQLIYFLN